MKRILITAPGFRDPFTFSANQVSSQDNRERVEFGREVSALWLDETLARGVVDRSALIANHEGQLYEGKPGPVLTQFLALKRIAEIEREVQSELNETSEEAPAMNDWWPEVVVLLYKSSDNDHPKSMNWRASMLKQILQAGCCGASVKVILAPCPNLVVYEYGSSYKELKDAIEQALYELSGPLDIRFCVGPSTPQMNMALMLIAAGRNDSTWWQVMDPDQINFEHGTDWVRFFIKRGFGQDGLPEIFVGDRLEDKKREYAQLVKEKDALLAELEILKAQKIFGTSNSETSEDFRELKASHKTQREAIIREAVASERALAIEQGRKFNRERVAASLSMTRQMLEKYCATHTIDLPSQRQHQRSQIKG